MALPQGYEIRPVAEPGDGRGIREVFALTGLLGEPVAKYFPRPGFLADAMVEYYLRFERPWAWVAEESLTRQVAGYIVGCPDTRARERRVLTWMAPALAWSFVRNGLCCSAAGWGLALRGLPEQVQESLAAGRGRGGAGAATRGSWAPDLGVYPAHLHMGVHPAHQRRGLGGALLEALLGRLEAAGVPGVHLITTSHHRAAAALYRRHGFAELARRRTRVFDHLLPGSMLPVERVVMGRRLAAAPRS